MRRGIFILAATLAGALCSRAQDKIVATFSETHALTTGTFTTADKWEIRWTGARALTLTVLGKDGTLLAGMAATSDGSLYQPKGGTFYLQITPSGPPTPWQVSIVQIGMQPDGAPTTPTAYVPPAQVPPAGDTSAGSGPAPQTTTPSGTPSQLTAAQAQAIVLVKGDLAQGTGFLTHAADGTTVVITNIHVLFANPNVKITTTDGREIQVLAYKGAMDRDLMMMPIKDDHYTYLDIATDVDHLVHEDDEALTPGDSEGGEVFLDTKGEVRGIGPQKVEFSNPIYHGNSGGPVVQVASGKVIAVVEGAVVVQPTDGLDRASFSNANSAITGSTRYFGLRIDTVSGWETYDWNRFLTESTFLQNFHTVSRCLDSLMNGARYEKAGLAVGTADDQLPSAHFYLTNSGIKTAMETFHQQAVDADKSQQMDADRVLYSDLSDVANSDMSTIQQPGGFYHFDQTRADQEITYRKALLKELDDFGDRLSNLGH